MQIYLTSPGGQAQGPFTLEEINRNLAAKKYRDTDYWAWFSGQTDWVPLHQIPGVVGSDDTSVFALDQTASDTPATPAQAQAPEPVSPTEEASSDSGAGTDVAEPDEPPADDNASTAIHELPRGEPDPSPPSPPPEPDDTPAPLERDLFSGFPFAALAQVFLLTTGDGPPASRSPATARMLEETAGETLAVIRERIPRDVVSHCAFMDQLRTQATLPKAAWSAMANFKAELVEEARAGRFKVCVRTFPIETGDLVCLFLFYDKQKL